MSFPNRKTPPSLDHRGLAHFHAGAKMSDEKLVAVLELIAAGGVRGIAMRDLVAHMPAGKGVAADSAKRRAGVSSTLTRIAKAGLIARRGAAGPWQRIGITEAGRAWLDGYRVIPEGLG